MKNKPSDNRPLGIDLASLAKAYAGVLFKEIEDLPLDRYFYVLVLIDDGNNAAPVTQQKLCEALGIDKTSLVRVLDFLSDKKLIERKVNPDDRREHFLHLTPKGEKILPRIKEGIQLTNEKVFAGFSKDEINLFYRYLYAICNNLSALPSHIVDIELKKINKS